MLLQRVVTALVLLLLMGGALLAEGAWPFALLTLALMAAAAWEWGRLNQAPPALAWAMGALVPSEATTVSSTCSPPADPCTTALKADAATSTRPAPSPTTASRSALSMP